jgi:hypothetical protein
LGQTWNAEERYLRRKKKGSTTLMHPLTQRLAHLASITLLLLLL